MFGSSDHERSSVSDFIEKKSRRLKKKKAVLFSKIHQALSGEHEHYFNKQDVLSNNQNGRCQICGMLLSEFIVEQNIKNSSQLLRSHQKL
jgi:predicted  nucleic acid-binding Zn-ribbon protein